MRFTFIFVFLLFGFLSPVYSACHDDVQDALDNFWKSGPFHYVSQEWNINFLRQTAGKVVSGNAEHRTLDVVDGIDRGELIFIGDKSWSNDGLGWTGPVIASWTNNFGIPKHFQFIKNAQCFGDVDQFGKKLKKFTYSSLSSPTEKEEKHTIYVDANSGRIIRHELQGIGESFIKTISTFRFDDSIWIEPPRVDH